MTNEEIKALLRELSETADAAGVSKKVRITFDQKRGAQQDMQEDPAADPDQAGDDMAGADQEDLPQAPDSPADPSDPGLPEMEEADLSVGSQTRAGDQTQKGKKPGLLQSLFRRKARRQEPEADDENAALEEEERETADGSEEHVVQEGEDVPEHAMGGQESASEGAALRGQEPAPEDTASHGQKSAPEETVHRHGSPEQNGTTYYDPEKAGVKPAQKPDAKQKRKERPQKTGKPVNRAEKVKHHADASNGRARRQPEKEVVYSQQKYHRRAGWIPVEDPCFEKDAADFRDNEIEAAAEEKESKKIRRFRARLRAADAALKAKGIGKKQILIALAILAVAAVIAGIVLYVLGNRAKAEHVTADEGLRILVQKEPSKWCRGGTVTLEIRTDEPMQSVTVEGGTTSYSGEKKTQVTFETTHENVDVMVVTQEKVLSAQVDFPKIDTEAPVIRVEEQDGLIVLKAEDLRSGVDQIWYGTIDGLSDVPAYQEYTEPFKPEEGKLYAYFARDLAGNQSARVTTDMQPASQISLPRQEIALFQGELWQMELEVTPANAFLNDLEWSSSDPQVASVDQTGLVSALSDGESVIQAKAGGVKSVSCLVRVRSEVDLTISAAGDVTLGEDINFSPINSFSTVQSMYGNNYFFENVRSVFETDDITFVNLEGTLTDQGTRVEKQYAFRGDPSYTQILTGGSIEAVTLANNHSSDYGEISLTDTQKYLDQAGIEWCNGDKIIVKDVNGVRVALIGIYVLADGEARADQVKQTIATAKEDGAQIVVVAFHWGNEMETSPDKTQQTLGHLAVDCGADLVVGHHPHVLQGIEKYSGKYICYSLGNFCFGGNSNPSDMDTMIFRQTFRVLRGGEVDSADVSVIPCTISSAGDWNNYQPTLAQGEEKDRIMEKINKLSEEFNVSF